MPFCLHMCYDALLYQGIEPRSPRFDASTLPLDYRGGQCSIIKFHLFIH